MDPHSIPMGKMLNKKSSGREKNFYFFFFTSIIFNSSDVLEYFNSWFSFLI